MNVRSTTCTVSETMSVWDLTSQTNHDTYHAPTFSEIFQREPHFTAAVLNPVDNEAQSGQNIVLRTIDDDVNEDHEMRIDDCDDNDDDIHSGAAAFHLEDGSDSNVSHDVKNTLNGASNLYLDETSRDALHPRVGVFDKFYESELNASQSNFSFTNVVSPNANEMSRNKSSNDGDAVLDASRSLSSNWKSESEVGCSIFRRSTSDDLMDDDVESDDERLTIVCDMDVDDEVTLKSPHKLIDKHEYSSNKKQVELSSDVSSDNTCLSKSSSLNLNLVSSTPNNFSKPSASGASIRSSLKRLNFKPLRKLIGNMCMPSTSANHISPVPVSLSTAVTDGLCSDSTHTATMDYIDFMNGSVADIITSVNLSASFFDTVNASSICGPSTESDCPLFIVSSVESSRIVPYPSPNVSSASFNSELIPVSSEKGLNSSGVNDADLSQTRSVTPNSALNVLSFHAFRPVSSVSLAVVDRLDTPVNESTNISPSIDSNSCGIVSQSQIILTQTGTLNVNPSLTVVANETVDSTVESSITACPLSSLTVDVSDTFNSVLPLISSLNPVCTTTEGSLVVNSFVTDGDSPNSNSSTLFVDSSQTIALTTTVASSKTISSTSSVSSIQPASFTPSSIPSVSPSLTISLARAVSPSQIISLARTFNSELDESPADHTLPTVSSVSSVSTVSFSSSLFSTAINSESSNVNTVPLARSTKGLSVTAQSSTLTNSTNRPIVPRTAISNASSGGQTSVNNQATTIQAILTSDSASRNKRKASVQTVLNDAAEDLQIKEEKLDDGYNQSPVITTAASCSVPMQGIKPVVARKRQKVAAELGMPMRPTPTNLGAASWIIKSSVSHNGEVVRIASPSTAVLRAYELLGSGPTPRGRPSATRDNPRVPRPSTSRLSFHNVTFDGSTTSGKLISSRNGSATSVISNRSLTPITTSPILSSNVSQISPSITRNSSTVTIVTNNTSPIITVRTAVSTRTAASISQNATTFRLTSVTSSSGTVIAKSPVTSSVLNISNSVAVVSCASAPKSVTGAVSSPRTKKNARRSARFWTKFKHWFKTNALDEKLAPAQAPAELHLPTITSRRVCECGDEFATAAGLEDHIARKSFAVSFSCRCDRVTRTFYNMCAYASFYKSHVCEISATGHLPASLCTMTVLPAGEMPEVYTVRVRELKESRERANAINITAPAVSASATEPSYLLEPSVAPPVTVDGNYERLGTGKECLETTESSTIAEPPSVCDTEPTIEVPTEGVDGEMESVLTAEKLGETMNGRMVRCSECPTVCKNRASLKTHFARLSHAGPTTGKVLLGCKRCAMIVPNMCAMRAHMRLHGENLQIFCCPECGLRFKSTKEVFMKHVEQVCLHYARVHGSECPKCEIMLAPSTAVITRHLVDQHSTTYHKCGSCPRAFTSEDGFGRHNADRHGGSALHQTISKCPICEMVLSSVDELETHVIQHLKEKQLCKTYQLSCFVCKKGQMGRAALIKHMVTEHRDRIITDHMCEVCGDLFGENAQSLYAHILANHREYALTMLRSNVAASPVLKRNASVTDAVPSVSSVSLSDVTATISQIPVAVESATEVASSEISDDTQATLKDVQFGCDRCQMTFKSAVRWKRHHAKHEYLSTKKLTVESGDTISVSSSSSQGLKVKISLNRGKEKPGASRSEENVSMSPDTVKRSTSEGKVKLNSSLQANVRKSPSRSQVQADVRKSPSRARVRSPESDASKKAKKTNVKSTKDLTLIQATVYSCDECNFRFGSEGEWKTHQRVSHKKKSWFSCHLCEVSFKSSTSLQAHLKEKHSGKVRQHTFICWVCRDQGDVKSYPRAGMLAKHLKAIHKISRSHPEYAKIKELEAAAGGTPPVGPVGANTATCPGDVRRLRVDGDDCTNYTCAQCEFTATERLQFVAHIKEHRESDAANQCQECGSCFSVLPALRRHLFAVHRVRDFERYCVETGVSLDANEDNVADGLDVCPLSMEAETDARSVGAVAAKAPKAASPRVRSTSPPVVLDGRLECTVCYRMFEDELAHRSHMRVHGMAFIQRTRRSISSVGAPPPLAVSANTSGTVA